MPASPEDTRRTGAVSRALSSPALREASEKRQALSPNLPPRPPVLAAAKPDVSSLSARQASMALPETERTASQEFEGNIRVAVRVRPLPGGSAEMIEVPDGRTVVLRKAAATGGNEHLSSQQGRTEARRFQRVFGPGASQEELYAWCCQPLVTAALHQGRHATVLVYGATGAGKTHTMFGEPTEAGHGIIFRAVQQVFSEPRCRELRVRASFLEVYNEKVYDLLQGGGQCSILEDERRGLLKISNLQEVPVASAQEAARQLQEGLELRKVESTAANARSSRSHAIFLLHLEGEDGTVAKISLIDLAGSERASHTQNSGAALRDGAKINQSLLALANCINALGESSRNDCNASKLPQRKPPYRDSKLTLLLKSSLVNGSFVSMIANIHPGRDHFEDSNNTLEYAFRASTVKPATVVRREPRVSSVPARRPHTHPELPEGQPEGRSGQSERPHKPERLVLHTSGPWRRSSAGAAVDLSLVDGNFNPDPGSVSTLDKTCRGRRSLASDRSGARSSSGRRRPLRKSRASPDPFGEVVGIDLLQDEETASDSNLGSENRSHPVTHRGQERLVGISSQTPQGGSADRSLDGYGTSNASQTGPDMDPVVTFGSRLPCIGTSHFGSETSSLLPKPGDRDDEDLDTSDLYACHSAEQLNSVLEGMRAAASAKDSALSANSFASREVLLRIISLLQSEKASLDSQLRSVTADRDRLSEECACLRAASIEKDRQLAELLIANPAAVKPCQNGSAVSCTVSLDQKG